MRHVIPLVIGAILFGGCSSDKSEKKQPEPRVISGRPQVVLETNMGNIVIELFPDVAPNHVNNFLDLVENNFYDSLTFHRALSGKLIQGGDPNGDGTGHAGYVIPAEFSNLQHLPGTLAMARGADPNSASCQFYITVSQMPGLDGSYTIFGQVIEGLDVARKISEVETRANPAMDGEKSMPVEPVVIVSTRRLPAG